MKTIPPYSEVPVLVSTSAAGTYVLKTCRPFRGKTAIFLIKDIVEVVLNRPSFITVAKVSNVSKTVPK